MPINGFIKPTDMFLGHYTHRNDLIGLVRLQIAIGIKTNKY